MIRFHQSDCRFTLREKKHIKRWLSDIIRRENKFLKSLDIVFVSDEFELGLNQLYLQHNYFTDILTFDYSEQPEIIEGELYISSDRLKENAKSYKVSAQLEAKRVLAHGVLHLCGYRDHKSKEKKEMTRLEDYYLSLY